MTLSSEIASQLESYAANAGAITHVVASLATQLDRVEQQLGTLSDVHGSVHGFELMLRNLAFNIQGHHGGTMAVDKARGHESLPTSPVHRWKWAYSRVKAQNLQGKHSMSNIKTRPSMTVVSRLERLEDMLAWHVTRPSSNGGDSGAVERLEQRISELSSKLDQAVNTVQALEKHQQEMVSSIEELERKVAATSSRVDGINTKFTALQGAMTRFDNRLTAVDAKRSIQAPNVQTVVVQAVPESKPEARFEEKQPPPPPPPPIAVRFAQMVKGLTTTAAAVAEASANEVAQQPEAQSYLRLLQDQSVELVQDIESVQGEDLLVRLWQGVKLLRDAYRMEPSSVAFLGGLCAEEGTVPFRQQLDQVLQDMKDLMQEGLHAGVVKVQVLDLQEQLAAGGEEDTAGPKLAKDLLALREQLEKKANARQVAGLARKEDLDEVRDQTKNLISEVEGLRRELLEELHSSRMDAQGQSGKLQELSQELGGAMEKFDSLRLGMEKKAEGQEVAEALGRIGAKLHLLASNSVQSDFLTQELDKKFDKDAAARLAGKMQGGEQMVDVGKPFFAVYRCHKPFKNSDLASMYSLSAAEGATTAPAPPLSITGPEFPELRRPSPHSPINNTMRPATVNDLNGPQSMRKPAEEPPLEAAAALSKYPRMMPAPVRVRTAAGGGVPGQLSRDAVRRHKLESAKGLYR